MRIISYLIFLKAISCTGIDPPEERTDTVKKALEPEGTTEWEKMRPQKSNQRSKIDPAGNFGADTPVKGKTEQKKTRPPKPILKTNRRVRFKSNVKFNERVAPTNS